MRLLQKHFSGSPIVARVAPFLVFLALTFCQGQFGEASRYWFYLAKTLVGAWLIWEMRPFVKEMRWAFSWEAVVVGVGIFAIWVGIDPFYPKFGELLTKVGLSKIAGAEQVLSNPHVEFGHDSFAAWFFIIMHVLGMSFVVPQLEEVFYRSFLYRYIAKPDFQTVALGVFAPIPFISTSAFFAFEHQQWLAGILCGAAYQWLVIRKNRLGDAMTAHAITNFLLGSWVAWRGAWQFW